MNGLWRVGAGLAAPALRLHLRLRARQGKEEAARLGEREGYGAARPPGPLFWFHAASVGESLALPPLLEAMAERHQQLNFLVTTGTVTSAALLPSRLPPQLAGRVQHRYVPLDVPRWWARFLDGWRPDAAALVESELWPNLLAALAVRRVPVSLVNGRLSRRSAERWSRFAPGLARRLLGSLALTLPRSREDAERLLALGAGRIGPVADLKRAAAPLPADPATLAALREAVGDRPVLLAASIHPGEDAQLLEAHARIGLPGLLTILAPRHPDRGAALAALSGGGRRAAGELPDGRPFYVADTMGELGLFYRLAGVAFIGGSLVAHGGQNPLEAARLLCPALIGPHHANFAEPCAELGAAGALKVVPDAAALAEAARVVLTDPGAAAAMRRAAQGFAEAAAHIPGQLAEALLATLPLFPPGTEGGGPGQGR